MNETTALAGDVLLTQPLKLSRYVLLESLDERMATLVHMRSAKRLRISRGLYECLKAFRTPRLAGALEDVSPEVRSRLLVPLGDLLAKGFLYPADEEEQDCYERVARPGTFRLFNCPPATERIADVTVLGIPCDLDDAGAAFSRNAPEAIRRQSLGYWYANDIFTGEPAGLFDVERKRQILAGVTMADGGDVVIEYGERRARLLDRIARAIAPAIAADSLLVILGGDVAVNAPVVAARAVTAVYLGTQTACEGHALGAAAIRRMQPRADAWAASLPPAPVHLAIDLSALRATDEPGLYAAMCDGIDAIGRVRRIASLAVTGLDLHHRHAERDVATALHVLIAALAAAAESRTR